MFEQLGLIGCGLIGGSFALALKRAGLVKRVVGYSKSPSTTERARQLGVIDLPAPSALLAVSGADLVLLAVPVSATEPTLKAIRHLVTDDMLVMDVGSTKHDVADTALRVLREGARAFVPCHPIAGKELAGVEHADAQLFANRQLIITPTALTLPGHLQRARQLWQALGSRVVEMTPETHDAAFAAVSHLPHLIAFAAVHGLISQPQGEEFLKLAGPGFRDFTRIAAGEPRLWRDVLLANRQEILSQSQAFRRSLDLLEQAMRGNHGEALEDLIRQASTTRANWRLDDNKT